MNVIVLYRLENVYPVRVSKLGAATNVVILLRIFEADPLSFVAINVVKYVVEGVKLLSDIFTLLGAPILQYVNTILQVNPLTGPDALESVIEY